ncbi:hypothetical protein B0J17DRAFT_452050 [Rhizoctonia solani]|nr:hypothetical protein B0J17DRAFT_452050 [Rhizoctonia solani]
MGTIPQYLNNRYILRIGSYFKAAFGGSKELGKLPATRYWSLILCIVPNSDDTCSVLKPRLKNLNLISSTSQPSALFPQGSDSLYTDDAHFHTDMLFNMPRAPFSRIQRIAALDWARKLGAPNVPTMESFDECERRLGAIPENNNDSGQND